MLLLTILTIIFIIVTFWNSREVRFESGKNNQLILTIQCGEKSQQIYPWYSEAEDVYYYFLPAFVKSNKIYNDLERADILILNEEPHNRYSPFVWNEEDIYSIKYNEQSFNIIFMHSENLETLFVTTESGGLDYIHENKQHEEAGELSAVTADGIIEYEGKLKRFSGRGNSTFRAPKKSYSFTLENGQELCGLEYGKKWNLLSLYYEQDKIHSKIVYDMAKYIGMEYAPDSTWVDVYCNGTYMGLYLLTESISVGEGRIEINDLEKDNEEANLHKQINRDEKITDGQTYAYYNIDNPDDISGGYLIEKAMMHHLEEDEVFFTTDICNYCFVVNNPSNISKEEYEYIKEFIQVIETSVMSNSSEHWEYLDMESFAQQYLIDKISMENDAMYESTFFYKEKGDMLLKAGPVWDYDRSFGEILTDYESEIEGLPNAMAEWYLCFYQDEKFKEMMIDNYVKLLPFFQVLLDEKIDQYVEFIDESRQMDAVLMSQYSFNDTCSYREYSSYIRYLKFFLINRLNYLSKLWNVECVEGEPSQLENTFHEVRFFDADGALIEVQLVLDGNFIGEFPDYKDGKDCVWRMFGNGKRYDSMIPIYENVDLHLEE